MSHQVGVNSVHWTEKDSHLAPVLALGPLSNTRSAQQGQPAPQVPVDLCGGQGLQESLG